MDFHLEQVFAADPDDVARAFADPALYDLLDALPKLGRPDVLFREVDGDTVKLQIRYRFAGELSSAARAVLEPARLTWVEHSTHDLAARIVTYRLVADHYADRFAASGGYRFVPESGGTRRIVDGTLNVRAPLVNRAVESAIISGMHENSDDEVALVERFLASAR